MILTGSCQGVYGINQSQSGLCVCVCMSIGANVNLRVSMPWHACQCLFMHVSLLECVCVSSGASCSAGADMFKASFCPQVLPPTPV